MILPPGSPLPPPPPPGALPPPGAPAPAPRRRTHRIRNTVIVVASLALVATGIFVLGRRNRGKDRPDEWDARITDLVAFVEGELDAQFKHPVEIRFLTDGEFEALVRTDEEDLSDEDEQAYRDQEAIGRALGLFSGETDLFEEGNDLAGTGILAYYSLDDEEIVARVDDPEATELDVDLRVTIAHELTHVWQDQHYDLDAVQDQADTATQSDAIDGLIEGHATWLENRYIDALSDADAAAYDEALEAGDEEYTEGTTGVTPLLEALQAAPYVLGPTFVTALVEADGALVEPPFIDEPPLAEDQLVLPSAYLDGDDPEPLDDPEVPEGTEEIARGQMGMPALYMMLAVGLTPPDALGVADGWGNDAYVAYLDGDRVCVRMWLVGDDEAAVTELERGLHAWAGAVPDGAEAAVGRTGDGGAVLEATACDPGTDTDIAVPGEAAMQQLFGRAFDLGYVIDDLGDVDDAECVVNALYTVYTYDEIGGLPQEDIDAAFAGCGYG